MVVHHQPLKAVRVEVQLVQRFVVAIGQVQVTDQTLYAVVPVVRAFQQMPVKAGIVVPFAPLRKFVAHKQQLFAREGEHPAVVGAQVGKLLPRVPRHAVENGFLAVHHFIVRQRQHEVFGVVVEQPESELIVVILTINRVELHVVERVVHPAEVPLVPEAQSAH